MKERRINAIEAFFILRDGKIYLDYTNSVTLFDFYFSVLLDQ